MLTLVTATPGSGKTLRCVELIYEALNKGHVVYSNILGLKVPGVIRIDTDTDWRDLDDFKRKIPHTEHIPISVFYDEAHEHQGFCDRELITITDKEEIKKKQDIGRSLSMHRHFGFDIYLITQHPSKLAKYVIVDVGRHIFLRRFFNMQRATIYEFPEAHVYVSKTVRADAIYKKIWKFPKHLYGSYTSTETNTHTTNIPSKYIILLVIFLILVIYFIFRASDLPFWRKKGGDHEGSKTVPVNLEQPSTSKKETKLVNSESKTNQINHDVDYEVNRVAMVIESSTDCYAKNSYGELIQMSISDCRMLSKNNKRMSMSRLHQDFSNLPVDYSASANSPQAGQNFNGFSTQSIVQ